jgi:hypothetical protein
MNQKNLVPSDLKTARAAAGIAFEVHDCLMTKYETPLRNALEHLG